MNVEHPSEGTEDHEQGPDGVASMGAQSSMLAAVQQRRSRGDISEEDYELFKREWDAQAALGRHFKLIDEVASQMVEQEDALEAQHMDSRLRFARKQADRK